MLIIRKIVSKTFYVLVGLATIIGTSYTIYTDKRSGSTPVRGQSAPDSDKPINDKSTSVIPEGVKQQKPVAKQPNPVSLNSQENWSKKYISSTTNINSPQSSEYTIIITNGFKKIDFGVTDKIGEIYKARGKNVNPAVLNSNFVTDGIFHDHFYGSIDREVTKAVFKHVDFLVLGKTSIQQSSSDNFANIEGMQNLITTEMKLSLRIISLKSNQIIRNIDLSSIGIGASKTKSTEMATDRIIQEVSKSKI